MEFRSETLNNFYNKNDIKPSSLAAVTTNSSIAGIQMEKPYILPTPGIKKDDELLENGFLDKLKYNIASANTIPVYITKGLKGDPSSNFHEFMQITNVPYYTGGPVLAALFYAGANNLNYQGKKAAKRVAKHIAIGVALYYIAAAMAKAVIDYPVKWLRGIDLNQPYSKVVESKNQESSIGYLKRTREYHKVFESIDFTRWDLLYNHDNPDKPINYRYDKIAGKYGFDENLNDSDSALKPYIEKTLIMSRAWKYLLTAPFVALGIGLASQEAWGGAFRNFGKSVREIFSFKKLPDTGKALSIRQRLVRTKNLLGDNFVKPFYNSFIQLWKGKSKITGAIGKTIILASALGTLYGNYKILKETSARKELSADRKNQQSNPPGGSLNDR